MNILEPKGGPFKEKMDFWRIYDRDFLTIIKAWVSPIVTIVEPSICMIEELQSSLSLSPRSVCSRISDLYNRWALDLYDRGAPIIMVVEPWLFFSIGGKSYDRGWATIETKAAILGWATIVKGATIVGWAMIVDKLMIVGRATIVSWATIVGGLTIVGWATIVTRTARQRS